MIIVKPRVSLEWRTPNALETIERAGRTCYKSEDRIGPDTALAFCGMRHQRGHESVVEHAVASLRIVWVKGVYRIGEVGATLVTNLSRECPKKGPKKRTCRASSASLCAAEAERLPGTPTVHSTYKKGPDRRAWGGGVPPGG